VERRAVEQVEAIARREDVDSHAADGEQLVALGLAEVAVGEAAGVDDGEGAVAEDFERVAAREKAVNRRKP